MWAMDAYDGEWKEVNVGFMMWEGGMVSRLEHLSWFSGIWLGKQESSQIYNNINNLIDPLSSNIYAFKTILDTCNPLEMQTVR